jgi:hypothetical protein
LAVKLSLDRCQAANNGLSGIRADGSNAIINISECLSSGNSNGLSTANSGQIVSSDNNRIMGNGVDGVPTSTPGQQ